MPAAQQQAIPQSLDVSQFPAVNAAMGGAHGLCLFTIDGSTWTALLVRSDFTNAGPVNYPEATGATAQAAIAALFASLVSSTAATAAAAAQTAQTAATVAAAVSGAAKGT